MTGMTSAWLYSGYNSDHGLSYTNEFNFAPRYIAAQASFYSVSGGGLHHTGITAYRFRPSPTGAEQTVNLGDWPSWQPYVYIDRASSITIGVAVGARQEARVLANFFFW